ncbi:hypothetical protein V6N13_088595 [Hibiscus sabdariffa]|uniref:Uncharacterized protein n=1 Tax=Hibiscus sabdariffa TaxID=183260 RepID=A0ABR2FZV8_9ROSI
MTTTIMLTFLIHIVDANEDIIKDPPEMGNMDATAKRNLPRDYTNIMEALRMRLFFAMVVVLMAVSAIQNVSAADAPAPSPTSDATTFVPTVFASLVALAFGLLF